MATTKPAIPFEFDPTPDNYFDHLTIVKQGEDRLVTWAPAGVTFNVPPSEYAKKHPEMEWPPQRTEVEKVNPGLATFYTDNGFSIGSYHEFLVLMRDLPYQGFRMGRIEVTFGQATPLMAFLFEGIHQSKYYGDWWNLSTARIIGANDIQEVELAFSNAAIRYNKKYRRLPTFWEMNLDEYLPFEDDKEESAPDPEVLVDGPIIRDIEPIRFLHKGLSQEDDVAACLYFYRVLEFYAFFAMPKEFAKVRHDTSISDESFPSEILRLLSRDEKGPILRLVNQAAGKRLTKGAARAGLIESESTNLLGERLYAFRNSIVHGKSSHGYELHSPPLFEKQSLPKAWRNTLRNLAQSVIEKFGRKLL